MIDDTRSIEAGEQSHRPFCLSQNVGSIMKHTMTRAHANRWARNLRFLTVDENNDKDQDRSEDTRTVTISSNRVGDCNDTKEVEGQFRTTSQCLPCEKRLSPPSGHLCEQHMTENFKKRSSEDREAEFRKFTDPCVHVQEHTCHECQNIPLFPNQGKVTRFRIRKLPSAGGDKLPECSHFVAVSYCWTNQGNSKGKPDESPYLVREENGTVRPMRAQRATIDRVVAFARENGFRMIWIDQECIEQDNPVEKELAIQAMDCVYLRAQTSIGLFQVQLQQRHLDCLLVLYEHRFGTAIRKRRGRRAFQGCRTINQKTIWEAMSMIANDRWNTRAWILQEAFASSGNMVLLFPKTNVRVNGWLLVCHELSQSDLAIRLDVIQQCLVICMAYLQPVLRGALTQTIGAKNSESQDPPTGQARSHLGDLETMKTTIKRVQLFHPPAPDHSGGLIINSTRPRRVCNAAVAMNYMRLRGLFRAADKLAIVANLCGYVIRLNTTELEKNQQSLSCCILTLALANSDFSLLIPQIYHPIASTQPAYPNNGDVEFSWTHSFTKNIGLVDAEGWNPQSSTSTVNSAVPIKLSERGLSFPGFLWQVDEVIDLTHLQMKYAEAWRRLCHTKRPRSGRTMMLATTHLLFETIDYLTSTGHKRVANSILNSTSNHRWRSRDSLFSGDMIESVDQLPTGLRVENRRGMFSLQPSPDGRYYQCWIIDRIMEKGCIWAAKLVTDTRNIEGQMQVGQYTSSSDSTRPIESETPTSSELKQQQSRTPDRQTRTETTVDPGLTSTAIVPGQVGDTEMREILETMDTKAGNLKSHSGNMRTISLITDLIEQVSLNDKDLSEFGQSVTSSAALFALVVHRMGQSCPPEKDELGRRAVFDLDGSASDPPMVLTPHQMVLESIPRSAARSMSVSWVVQPRPGAPSDDERVKEAHQVLSMVQGMWEFSVIHSGRYLVV